MGVRTGQSMKDAIGGNGEMVAREGSALAASVERTLAHQEVTLALFQVLAGTPRIYAGMPVPEAVGGQAEVFARNPESSLARLANGILSQADVAMVMAADPAPPPKCGGAPQKTRSIKGGL